MKLRSLLGFSRQLKRQPGSEFFRVEIAAAQTSLAHENREEAERCFRRALNEIQSDGWRYWSEWDRSLGAQAADTFAALAEIHGKTGAFGLMARAIEHARYAKSQFGLQHPEVANRIEEVGHLYLSLQAKTTNVGDYDYFYAADMTSRWRDIARALQREALNIREKVLGAFHPDVAESLEAIAGIPVRSDIATKLGPGSLPMYERALGIRERALGPEHPDVATSLERYASANGRWDESSKLMRRALRIREKAYGFKHPLVAETLEQLSECLRHSPHRTLDERESLLKDASALRSEVQGTDHPDFAETLFQLWFLYDSEDRRNDADLVLERAIAVLLRAVGIDDPAWHGRRELIEFVFPPEIPDYKVFRRVSVAEDASQLLTLNPTHNANTNTTSIVSRLPRTLDEVLAYGLRPSSYDSTVLTELANVVFGGYARLLDERGWPEDCYRVEELTDPFRFGIVPQGWTDRLLRLRQIIARGRPDQPGQSMS